MQAQLVHYSTGKKQLKCLSPILALSVGSICNMLISSKYTILAFTLEKLIEDHFLLELILAACDKIILSFPCSSIGLMFVHLIEISAFISTKMRRAHLKEIRINWMFVKILFTLNKVTEPWIFEILWAS